MTPNPHGHELISYLEDHMDFSYVLSQAMVELGDQRALINLYHGIVRGFV
jgi:hypothetical protein